MIEAVIHPDEATAFADALGRCIAAGEPFAVRHRLRRADGVYRWMSSRAEAMRDQDGGIVQWSGLCHDIDDLMEPTLNPEIGAARPQRTLSAVAAPAPARPTSDDSVIA